MWGELLAVAIVGALFLAVSWLRHQMEQPRQVECHGHGCCHSCCKSTRP